MNFRWLISGLLLFTSQTVFSQIFQEIRTGMSHREVVSGTDGCTTPPFCHYYQGFVSWNDDQIKELAYRGHQGSSDGPVVEFMNFRIVFPPTYDSTRSEKYPMIVMLHGAGESGRLWSGQYNYPTNDVRFDNNGSNIVHGGQAHLNAVNRNPSLSNSFPGIVLWPQTSYNGAWESGWQNGDLSQNGRMVATMIEWLLMNKNIDPDRVYMHGLSNGAKGTWDLAAKRPDLFAAILPMAGVGSNNVEMAPILNTMPLWLFQGGTDTNPRPQAAVDAIAALQAEGGNPRYTLYPTLGHGVWNTAYAESDFFPWMKSKTKKDIYVFGGTASICPGGKLKLGFSANMLDYRWRKNGVIVPDSTSRYFTVDEAATYVVEFKRQFGADEWISSNPVTVTEVASAGFVPVLTNTGSTNLTINIGGVQNTITLNTQAGHPQYEWYKGTTLITTTTIPTYSFSNNTGSAGDAGTYRVKIKLQTGCITDYSNPVVVSWFSTQPTTPAPSAPSVPVTSSSPTEIQVTWVDYSNESKYELWRFRWGGAGYPEQLSSLVAVLDQNTTTYLDKGLRPGALYKYRIRAILPSGQAIFSEESQWGTLGIDDIPPTSPTNLAASNITDNQVTLTWDVATDNDVIYAYELFNGSILVATLTYPYNWVNWSGVAFPINSVVRHNNRLYIATSAATAAQIPPNAPWSLLDADLTDGNLAPLNSYTFTGLEPNTVNIFSVRAVDWKGNFSPFSNSLSVSTQKFIAGLDYRYYQLDTSLPLISNFNFNTNPTRIGQTTVNSNFQLGSVNFGTRTSPYIVEFEGYLLISTIGTYSFRTSSNDGSILYIDLGNGYVKIIENDNGQRNGTVTVPATGGVPINFTNTGRYPIKIVYSQITGGTAALNVQWTTPSNGNFSNIQSTNLLRLDRTFYYLKTGAPGDDPSVTSAWTTNSNGADANTAPTDAFTLAQRYFVVANRPTVTLSNPLSITGSGSKLIVGNGSATPVTLNLDAALTATLEANQQATINVNHSTLPKFGQLHTNSTVNFNVPGTVAIPNAIYGNVVLNPAQYNLPLSTTTVQGNLTLQDGVTTTGQATNNSTLRVGGNLIVNNATVNPFPATGANQYALIFTGGGNHQVNFTNSTNPSLFSLQTDFGDNVTFANLSDNTITVGSNQGGGLTLKNGSTLNLGNNHLVVNGRGTINANNETGGVMMEGGNLTFTSTATQNNNLNFANDSYLNNLVSSVPTNNRISLLGSVTINNLVSVNSGQLNTGDGYLTLRSISDAANGTARIGPLLNGASVTGKIKMQRYMSGEGRIYRYISSPVAGVTVADLQEFFPITGNFTGTSTGPGLLANASMFTYNETSNPQYQQFPTVGGNNLQTLERGKGYTPFIRETSEATVIELMGEPHQGNVTFSLTGNPTANNNLGWNLLGNPYPAPVKWNEVGGWTRTGVNAVAYIRENSNGTTIVKSHDGSVGTNGWDGVIAPGQAFWVRTEVAVPTLVVNENAKRTADGAFYREGWPANSLEVKMKSATRSDNTIIRFIDGANAAFDSSIDGLKQDNTFFNLSTLTTDNLPLAINLTTTNYCEQEVKLRITQATAGNYELEIFGVESLISGDEVTFTDNFTHTQKVIGDSEVYAFSITADPASKADGRFTLRFKKPEVVLNQTLKAVAACEQDSPVIKINNSQPGVTYQAFVNGLPVSDDVTSVGGTLELPVNANRITTGETITHLKAGFKGCNSYDLPMTIAVQRDSLPQPEIAVEATKLIASTEGATYQWYYNGKELEDQTNRELLAPEDGWYKVEVFKATCQKMSDSLEYIVTGVEKPNRLQRLYPNPTREKVIVEMQYPIAFETVRVITTLGQVIPVPAVQLSAESGEVDLSALPTGLYLLQINRERYRILKE